MPFFRGISSEQIIALVPAVTLEYAMPGRYLIREGLDAHGLYMIARGRVQIVDRAGKQLAQRYVGEFVGEVSLLQSTPAAAATATATAAAEAARRRASTRAPR